MSLNRRKPLGRGKPLKRSPMKRTGASLQRKAPVAAARKAIAPRSDKRKAQMVERAKLWDVVRAEQGARCDWPRCGRDWVDLHEVHTRARSGGNITDRRIIIGLCREHNGRAGDDPRSAECLGVVVPSWAAENDIDHAMRVAAAMRINLDLGDPQPCPWRRDGQPCPSPLETQRERCEALHRLDDGPGGTMGG